MPSKGNLVVAQSGGPTVATYELREAVNAFFE